MNGKKYWDRAWSLVRGCSEVSPACDNCWLRSMERFHVEDGFVTGKDCKKWTGKVEIFRDRLTIPFRRKQPTVYAIWSDLFHEVVPTVFIDDALEFIHSCPQHTFLALTKRPLLLEEKIYGVTEENGCRALGGGDYLSNLWIGTTVENQQTANERISHLLKVPGNKFLSVEPMLGPVIINAFLQTCRCGYLLPEHGDPSVKCSRFKSAIGAVICGGESGAGARPMNTEWVRSLRDQCANAGVSFFFKQWDGRTKSRELDGREHNDLPWRQA